MKKIEALSTLYIGYRGTWKVCQKSGNYDQDQIISVSELNGLDSLLTNADAYLKFADILSAMRYNLRDFNESMEETLEYVIKNIRGQFNGRSEAEMQSVSSLLGLIPIATNMGTSEGKISGDVNLGVYDLEKLVNTIPSTYQWLRDFLAQYVAEINKATENVEPGEPYARLKVEIDRMNNAIQDCYQENNVVRLKFASKNLLGGLRYVREMMFPINNNYPEKDNFARESRDYIDSLNDLREFGEGKERIRFIFSGYSLEVGQFRNESSISPITKSKGFWKK